MSLASFFGIQQLTPAPDDPFWYGPVIPPTASGMPVTEATAMTYSAVWAATRLLSATSAALPLNLKRYTANGSETQFDDPRQRRVHSVPNDEMGSMMFRSTTTNCQVNWGNGYAEIERFGNDVKLWPIHASRVEPKRDDNGQLIYHINGDDQDMRTVELPASEVLHVPSMISSDGIVGRGVIRNARESIGLGMATERQGAAYFKNSARPAVVIKGGKFKDKEAREDYRRMWSEVHGGAVNNAKPAMLPQDADISILSFSPEDSQFLQTRQHNTEEIARWYGVPPHMIGHLLRSTFNNIETQSIEFVTYSLIPWLKLWEEELNRKLLTEQEQQTMFFKHNVEGLLRGDTAARAAFYTALFGIGVFSINDILQLEDRNTIGDDGDKRFVPLNMTTVENAGELPEPTTPPAQPADDELTVNGNGHAQKAIERLWQFMDDGPDQLEALARIESQTKQARIELTELKEHPPQQTAALEAEHRRYKDEQCRRALACVQDVLGIMQAKERDAAKRAANAPQEYIAKLDAFYEGHKRRMKAALEKSVAVYLHAIGSPSSPQEVVSEAVEEYSNHSYEMLLDAADGDPAQFAERVAACVESWADRTLTLESYHDGDSAS